jgi:dihydropteroate synthase
MVNSRVEDKQFPRKRSLKLRDKIYDLSSPKIMGIMNVTPDSFYEDGRISTEKQALITVEKMIKEGADMLDIGAYSSRPGAIDISEFEELDRITPILKAIRAEFPEIILSIDTFRSEVAHSALSEGADIINDISGGLIDPDIMKTVAAHRSPYILMHMRGTPQSMTDLATYEHLFNEVNFELSDGISKAKSNGIHDIIIDPGFGFAKNSTQNFELMGKLPELSIHQCPILVGISRKSMIYRTLESNPENALNGTTILNTCGILNGADILRVHDVKEAKEILSLIDNFS